MNFQISVRMRLEAILISARGGLKDPPPIGDRVNKLCSNFCLQLLFTNYCSQLLLTTCVQNFCWQLLFTNFVNNPCS